MEEVRLTIKVSGNYTKQELEAFKEAINKLNEILG